MQIADLLWSSSHVAEVPFPDQATTPHRISTD
jgi:hypothetical protein